MSQRQFTVPVLFIIARSCQQAERSEATERADHSSKHDKREAVLPSDTIENFYHETISAGFK
jgi:hypothetical protein